MGYLLNFPSERTSLTSNQLRACKLPQQSSFQKKWNHETKWFSTSVLQRLQASEVLRCKAWQNTFSHLLYECFGKRALVSMVTVIRRPRSLVLTFNCFRWKYSMCSSFCCCDIHLMEVSNLALSQAFQIKFSMLSLKCQEKQEIRTLKMHFQGWFIFHAETYCNYVSSINGRVNMWQPNFTNYLGEIIMASEIGCRELRRFIINSQLISVF